jgi:hypothetical protein
VAGSCKCGVVHSGSVKDREYLDKLTRYLTSPQRLHSMELVIHFKGWN